MPDSTDVPIRAVGATEGEHECRVTAVVVGSECRITATVDAGDPITVQAGDFFEALRMVRRVLDGEGLRLCCAGARRDAWPSAMQRQAALGRSCYLHTMPRTRERLPVVGIFDAAPPDAVDTVAAQDQFHKDWLASTPEG